MNKITKNYIYNLSGNMLSKIVSFLVVAFSARFFGSEIFGESNIALVEYSYFSMFAAFGMNGYGLYLLAKEGTHQERQRVLNEIYTAKCVLGIVAASVMFAYSLLPNAHRYIWPYVALLLMQAFDVSWALNALQDMKMTAYSSIIAIPINTTLILLFYFLGVRNVYALVIPAVVSQMVLYWVYTYELKSKHGFSLSFCRVRLLKYMKCAFPYMTSGVFAAINANIDMVILGYTSLPQETGLYTADYKLINEFVLICSLFFAPLFPIIIEKTNQHKLDYINKLLGYARTMLMSFIIPCALLICFYGRDVLTFIYGLEYENGYMALAILMIYLIFLYYREVYGYVLSGAGYQSSYLKIVAISALSNIILNLLFIPKYGIVAAATTTLVSEIINLIGMEILVRKHIGVQLKNVNLHRLLAAIIIMILALVILKVLKVHAILACAIALILYSVLFLLLRIVSVTEIKDILKGDG